jgi:hypothetical protein
MAGAINYNMTLGIAAPKAKAQPAPNWNANDGAFKDLYPGVETLSEGMWGFRGADEVAKLNQEWFADQKKQAKPPMRFGAVNGGFGAASFMAPGQRSGQSGFTSGWAGSGLASSLGIKGF